MTEILTGQTGRHLYLGAEGRFRRVFGPGPTPGVPQWPTAPDRLIVVDTDDSGGASWGDPKVSDSPVESYVAIVTRTDVDPVVVIDVQELPATARSFDAPMNLPEGVYDVEVLAVNGAGYGTVARATFGTDPDQPPPAPDSLPPLPVSGLVASVPATDQVRADWTPPEDDSTRADVTGYRAELLSSGGSVLDRQEPLTAASVLFSGVTAGDRSVRVAPITALGYGPTTTSSTVTVGGAPATPPGPVQNLARTLTGAQLEVTYTAPATGAPVTLYRHELKRDGLLVATREDAGLTVTWSLSSSGSWTDTVTPLSTAGPGTPATTAAVTYTVATPTGILPPIAPAPRPARRTPTREYRLVGNSNNDAALQTFLHSVAEEDACARVVGAGNVHRVYLPPTLHSLKQDGDVILTGETQGHLYGGGTLSTRSWPVTGSTEAGDYVITVPDPSGLQPGDHVLFTADRLFSHKTMNPGNDRVIVSVVGNQVELDLPLSRTVEESYAGSSTNRRLKKWSLADTLEVDGTGRIRHRDFKGMSDGDNFVQQLQTTCFAAYRSLYLGRAGEPFTITEVGGTGVQPMAGIFGGEWHLDISKIPDLTRDAPSIAHWGYGVAAMGGRDIRLYLKATDLRHAFTTDWPHWTTQSHWEALGLDQLYGVGEAEGWQLIYDVFRTKSTGVNTHENGHRLHHRGSIRDTGTWGNDAELKRDPTGGFIRSPQEVYDGVTLERIAVLTSTKWYAALTVAEAAKKNAAPWAVSQSPVIRNSTVGEHNCKSGILVKQPAIIGPNVDVFAPPGTTAIQVQAEGAGSRIVAPVRVFGGGTLVTGAQYLTNSELVTRA